MVSDVSTKAVAEYIAGIIAASANLADARAALGLGTMAVQNASAVAVTGGSLTGVSVSATSLRVTAGPLRIGVAGEVSLPRVEINGAASAAAFSPANQALYAAGTLAGSGGAPYSVVSVNDVATGANQTFTAAMFLAHNINAGASTGNRCSLLPILTKNVALAGNNPLNKFYLPLFPQFYINAGDGGTGTSDWRGDHYGFGSLVQAQSGAKWLNSIIGAEVDVSMQANSSAKFKVGLQIISVNSDAIHGYTWEAMLAFMRDSTTSVKWNNGIIFGSPYGLWPFENTATIIGTYGSGIAAGTGIDFTSVTFNTAAIKTVGFTVSPTGVITSSTVISTGAAAGLVANPRSGTGAVFQWYNGTGASMMLYNGTRVVATFDNSNDGSASIVGGFSAFSLAAVNSGGAAVLGLSGNGVTPNKYVRSYNGNFDVLNSAGNLALLSIDNTGNATLAGGLVASSLGGLNTGVNGVTLSLLGNGATTPNKYIRVVDGAFYILNSALSGAILSLTDAGQLSLNVSAIQNAANDSAAATAGVPVGGVYRNGSVLMVRVT